MKSPFPGMDPYLEQHWGDIHSSLVLYARDALQGDLPGDLFARVEERVYLEAPETKRRNSYPDVQVVEHPRNNGGGTAVAVAGNEVLVAEPSLILVSDDPVTETYVEILDGTTGNRVVTIIEFFSPSNKFPGEGRDLIRKKQQEVQAAGVNLAEIDLLRAGERVFLVPSARLGPDLSTAPYMASVYRARTGMAEVYPLLLRKRLPGIRIPLRPHDDDVVLDLQALVDQAYRNGRYGRTLDYSQPPKPPLNAEDAGWAAEMTALRGQA